MAPAFFMLNRFSQDPLYRMKTYIHVQDGDELVIHR